MKKLKAIPARNFSIVKNSKTVEFHVNEPFEIEILNIGYEKLIQEQLLP